MKYEVSIDIVADTQLVWEVLTDLERWPEWTQSVTRLEWLSSPTLALGSRARIKQPRLKKTVWTVTALEPPTGFSWEARQRGLTTIGSHRLDQRAPGRTTVTLAIEQHGALAPIVWFLSSRMMRRYLDFERGGLKARSEALAADAHQPKMVLAAGQ
jgi:hypothetical protein